MPLPDHVSSLAKDVMALSCDDQHKIAEQVAANIGYVLLREDDIRHGIIFRLDRLETAVLELNPGLNWRR